MSSAARDVVSVTLSRSTENELYKLEETIPLVLSFHGKSFDYYQALFSEPFKNRNKKIQVITLYLEFSG